MKSSIVVRTSFEGIHRFADAPQEVGFLREPHRHIFSVEVEMEVFHDDRELEFIMVKHNLNKFLFSKPFGIRSSCEQMANEIIEFLVSIYGKRQMIVGVFEDNENGGRVYYGN